MKWLRTLVLFDTGQIVSSPDWIALHDSFVRSVASVDFPIGCGTLTLRRKTRRDDGQWNRNGVGYLRTRFLQHIVTVEGWRAEGDVQVAHDENQPSAVLYPSLEPYREPILSEFGGFDLVTTGRNGLKAAIEWETGNISSSHRSMNKLAIALANGVIDIGVLIVPSRSLYEHLTDRIGNIGELSPYLTLWEGLRATVPSGLLAIAVVEQDELTDDVAFPYLPSGKDGNAGVGRAKRR